MRGRRGFALLLCAIVAGCGWTAVTSHRQTLLGVTPARALIATHRVLVDQGYEIDDIDSQIGTIRTAWRDRAQRSSRVIVTLSPGPPTAGPTTSILEIRAEARDRAVDGWTGAYAAPDVARRLGRRVARRVGELDPEPPLNVDEALVEEAVEPPDEPAGPERRLRACASTRDCPPGQHCGAGLCVWECATDRECGESEVCDRRGRCLAAPRPAPPSDGGPPAAPDGGAS